MKPELRASTTAALLALNVGGSTKLPFFCVVVRRLADGYWFADAGVGQEDPYTAEDVVDWLDGCERSAQRWAEAA